ncbi:MAG: hypothetical protein MZU95_13390 [Desulfomicrobium escambiense]|nr:hypothetical protein [Desulfomicrobium escambiense]
MWMRCWTALDRLIAKKRDLKQAAMQQLLTGQTRLPGFGRRVASRRQRLGDSGEVAREAAQLEF